MEQPHVTCIMLTANRPEMAARAVRCFRAQTYQNKRLQIYDTGDPPLYVHGLGNECYAYERGARQPIGVLRNKAITYADADIFVHLDDDDYSHPNRIAEQVALLQESGADAVGYREMLFWAGSVECPVCNGGRDDNRAACQSCDNRRWVTGTANGAWLYSNDNPRYALGTSLCYWRKTWERKPFPETKHAGADDLYWLQGLKVQSRSAARWHSLEDSEPMMVATIHGSNTCGRIDPACKEWRRVPEWDARIREILESA